MTVTNKKEISLFVDFVMDLFTVIYCMDLKCFAWCFFLFLWIFPCRSSRSGCFLVVSFRVFKYYLSFYGERNEEFMVCLLNDHLVAEAIELSEGKMNSNHLHDFKNSGFCKICRTFDSIDTLAKIIRIWKKPILSLIIIFQPIYAVFVI